MITMNMIAEGCGKTATVEGFRIESIVHVCGIAAIAVACGI